jgi:hypothetical protein
MLSSLFSYPHIRIGRYRRADLHNHRLACLSLESLRSHLKLGPFGNSKRVDETNSMNYLRETLN